MASGTEAVTVEQVARALGVPAPAPPLPSGYTRLEYIESDGRQYIDTELKPDQNMRVRAVFDCVDTNNTIMFGARPKANNSALFFLLHAQDTNSFRDDWGTDRKTVPTSSVPTSGTVEVDKDKNKTVFNGSYTVEHPSSTWSSQYNLYLFAGNNGGAVFNPTSIRLRSFEVWDGDEKVRDMVPARRASDGAVGMYDTVGGTFLGNSGSGAFKAGPEVATSPVGGADGAVVTLRQFKVAAASLAGGDLPETLTEVVLHDGDDLEYKSEFPFELDVSKVRSATAKHRITGSSKYWTYTYAGEPTGTHWDTQFGQEFEDRCGFRFDPGQLVLLLGSHRVHVNHVSVMMAQ